MLDNIAIEQFQASLRGQLINPQDKQYEAARKVYNGMIDKHPRLIANCADVADVISSISFIKDHRMPVAIRGGGHNGAGLGVCNDGLVIDLSNLRGVRFDGAQRTVRVAGGCIWGDVDHATHPFGAALPSGIISTTGVGGLTLGGGHGYLTRKYGLTIDNLLEADVVLADGTFVTASEDQNDDLFWALRGGGGNFGIVTSFLFKTHPISTIYGGPMLWHLDQAEEVMKWYREFLPSSPDDVYGFFAFLVVPEAAPFPEKLHGKTMCGVVWCHTGRKEAAEEIFKSVGKRLPPVFEHTGPIPYPVLQGMFDGLYPPGLRWYWKGDFVNELNDESIALHIKHGGRLSTSLSSMHLYPIDGAVNRVKKEDTAFSYRDAKWSMVIAGVSPDPADDGRITKWAKDYWAELHPYSAGGAYVNFMMEEGQDRIQATYRDNYDRLVEVKKKYDPSNLFQVNQNIRPGK